MTEQPPDRTPLTAAGDVPADHGRDAGEPEPAILPRWVPVLIGVVLASLAGLAVYTGIRYRDEGTITRHVRPRQDRAMSPSAPGEPGAGGSLVLHGEQGAKVPTAGERVTGRSRAIVSGGPEGVEATVRIWARRGMVLDVTPADAMVYVNDLLIGQANQFDTMDEVYDFPEPGSYTIRLVSSSGNEKRFVITSGDDARSEIARVSARLDGP